MTSLPTHIYNYNSDTFIDHICPLAIRERESSEGRVVSIERMEHFTSEMSKKGKIVTISSPKSVFNAPNSFCGVDSYCFTRYMVRQSLV